MGMRNSGVCMCVREKELDRLSTLIHPPISPHNPGQAQGLGTLRSEAAPGKEPVNYTSKDSLPAFPVSSLHPRP